MKNLLLVLLSILGSFICAQEKPTLEQFLKIAKAEEMSHQSLSAQKTTNAISDYDIVYHRCNWTADPSVRFIEGEITTYFKTLSANFDTIRFDLMDILTVDSVIYHNGSANFNHSNNVVSIILPNAIGLNVLDSVTVFYHGVPPTTGFGSFETDIHNNVPVMWTLSQPYGARDWWPCKNGLNDKADSIDIYITTPSIYKAGSNGVLKSEFKSNGNSTYYWSHRHPIATYLIAFAITNYAEFNVFVPNGTDSIPVLHYVYPEDSAQSFMQSQGIIPIMTVFDSLFGEYPFADEKYGHCQISWGGGMEHQTNSFMGSLNFELQAHEAAHQWFGDKVTCGSWQDIWLNEGFATYLTGLTYENLAGGIYWIPYMSNLQSFVTSQPDGSVWVDDTTSVSRIFNSRLTYAKGALILHQLRWVIGDSAFFEASNNYLQDTSNAFGFSRTDNLISHFENTSGQNLSWYFDDWFTGEGFPSYNLTWSHINDTVYIKLDQTQSDPSVSFFELPVPVRINSQIQPALTARLENTSSGQNFKVYYPGTIHSLEIDPELWLISANNSYTIGVNENDLDQLASIFPNPAKDIVNIQFPEIQENINAVLTDEMGRVLKTLEFKSTSSFTINTEELKSGLYMVSIELNGKVFTHKIVIQH